MLDRAAKGTKIAGIAQLVEHHLAKVEVASSSLVSRSNFSDFQELDTTLFKRIEHHPHMAEGPGSKPSGPTKSMTYWGDRDRVYNR